MTRLADRPNYAVRSQHFGGTGDLGNESFLQLAWLSA